MGYELWTSPITGYRRRGTRLTDFNEALGDRLTARDISEPIRCCPAESSSLDMAEQLRERDFDVAGVRTSRDESVTGWVRQVDLTDRKVRDHQRSLEELEVADQSTPLRDLFLMLKRKPFILVREQGEINGILTRADLNKPLVRVYLFGLISLLEIHMGFWVAKSYPGDGLEGALPPARLELALQVRQERRQRGQDLSVLQCLQFCDKQKLLISDNEIRERLGLGSKQAAKGFLSLVQDLRDALAHSQYDLTAGQSWSQLIDLVERVQAMITISDAMVEQGVADISAGNLGALW